MINITLFIRRWHAMITTWEKVMIWCLLTMSNEVIHFFMNDNYKRALLYVYQLPVIYNTCNSKAN